jgi:hypothetical protein
LPASSAASGIFSRGPFNTHRYSPWRVPSLEPLLPALRVYRLVLVTIYALAYEPSLPSFRQSRRFPLHKTLLATCSLSFRLQIVAALVFLNNTADASASAHADVLVPANMMLLLPWPVNLLLFLYEILVLRFSNLLQSFVRDPLDSRLLTISIAPRLLCFRTHLSISILSIVRIHCLSLVQMKFPRLSLPLLSRDLFRVRGHRTILIRSSSFVLFRCALVWLRFLASAFLFYHIAATLTPDFVHDLHDLLANVPSLF